MQCATVATHQFTARATERAATRATHRQMHSAAGYQQSGGQRAGLSTARRRGQGVARAPHPVGALRVDGMPLIESDSVLGANGNKWEAHAGATAPGQFCAFDTAQGRAVRNFYTDFANEVA